MPTPPELNQQFSSPAERAAAQADLRHLGEFVREIIAAANGEIHVPGWLTAELQKPLRGHSEPPDERLARYYNVFSDELQALNDTLPRGGENHLDDDSLRAARYLTRRLLATLLDCPSSEVSERLPANPS